MTEAIEARRTGPPRARTNRGFVVAGRDGFRIDRRRKMSSIVPNEIVLSELQRFLEDHFGSRRGGVLLDVGAGLKPYAVVYDRYFDRSVSVDVPTSEHDIAVDVIASADDLPFEDGTFDCVLCTEVLEHCADPDRAMSEIRRVLKPGGRALVTTPFLVGLHEMPYDFYRYTPSGLREVAVAGGMEIESIIPKGDYLAVVMTMMQFPLTKGWQALSKLARVNLFRPGNPFLWLGVVMPQLVYLKLWRAARRNPKGLLGRVSRKLDYITLGYVTRLYRSR